jgi:hypothetical protein
LHINSQEKFERKNIDDLTSLNPVILRGKITSLNPVILRGKI